MARHLRLLAIAALCLATTALPAAADDDTHPGVYIPSPESQSKNMHLLAALPRTGTIAGYRNSDLAFWGDLAFAGHYEGFRIIDVSEPESPVVVSDVSCPGSQHDVSVWENLLFLSIDAPRTGPTCDSAATAGGAPGFEGIRIFDVGNPASPQYVGAVATDCGSHTHTLVPDTANGRVLLYVSSYPASGLGTSPFGNSCARLNPDGSQGHSKISVVAVPLAAPATASVISQPRFELNDFRATPGFRGCHDITVFLDLGVAGAACLSESQIWDISDLTNPRTTARVHNPNVDIWHSAAFTWDGEMVVFGDEAGGGTAPRCRASDPSTLGAVWMYDLSALDNLDGTTQEAPLGHFKIPRVQGDAANCTMHNFNFIPVRDRYVLVSSSYAGGTSVADLSDPANPVEVAHLDPHGANTWSSYWYNNFIYANDTGRGTDIILLSSRFRAGARKFPYMNPQTQEGLIG